jgi:hypothetical protein
MASTRNKNTPGNYCLQQRNYNLSNNYTLYPNSQYGYAYDTKLAGNGLLAGQIPADKLSKNSKLGTLWMAVVSELVACP